MVDSALYKLHGATGLLNIDESFLRLICGRKFKVEGQTMKQNIAALARKLATETIDPSDMDAFTACRLMPMYKNPGIRPIGVGEMLRRLMGKLVSWVCKSRVPAIISGHAIWSRSSVSFHERNV